MLNALGERLASYNIPPRLLIIAALPRNAMGKMTKPAIVKLFKATRASDVIA